MSRSTLRKELAGMSDDQLRDLILEVYDAVRPARDYLEFYLNPDVSALTQKYMERIDKEVWRSRHRESKARISHIKADIKQFALYGVGLQSVNTLRLWTVRRILAMVSCKNAKMTVYKGAGDILSDMLVEADKNGCYTQTMQEIGQLLENAEHKYYIGFINYLRSRVGLDMLKPSDDTY